ncbi:uncharacterized protein LOC143026613 isoform X2 [Oratosquilla oratoria]|uniref:uncharacterized protein LOC143026613 isoform X2 n=1 Tax=Oratosquilla oratoria TaxID=337810 RepID=UPI003F76A8BB
MKTKRRVPVVSMPVHSVSDISELEISTIAADTTEPDLTESISTSISVQTQSYNQASWFPDIMDLEADEACGRVEC